MSPELSLVLALFAPLFSSHWLTQWQKQWLAQHPVRPRPPGAQSKGAAGVGRRRAAKARSPRGFYQRIFSLRVTLW